MSNQEDSLRQRLGAFGRRCIARLARLVPSPVLRIVHDGVEVEVRRRSGATERQVETLTDTLSDGELVVRFAEVLFHGRGAWSEDVEHWKRVWGEDREKRAASLREAVSRYLERAQSQSEVLQNPYSVLVLGTQRTLRLEDWRRLAAEFEGGIAKPKAVARLPTTAFRHSGNVSVSAIASLYKGGKYIEAFLDNITSQTIFDRSELIIIDANSPDNECEIIERYCKIFPNIIYKRIGYRIGVYDAWNMGVKLARGRFITNTNLDDLRRNDSFEIQELTLQNRGFVDVVYQDVFYSMNSKLRFDEVASIGIKTDVPIITPHNLLVQNSPHNAPMWRRELHDDVGLFDTTFESAGDWEFWLRCASKGKVFFKINEPHVAYFQNPEGVSTRPNSKGVREGARVWRRYGPKLVSPLLRRSRAEFDAVLGGETDWTRVPTYYDAVQLRLNHLGQAFRAQSEVHRGRAI